MGGEDGDTAVVGGFRNYADKEERQGEWDKIFADLPERITEKIAQVVVPTSRSSIVLIKIKQKQSAEETRKEMLEWTREFKALKIETQLEGETRPRTLYAAPSKPFSMRQRDGQNCTGIRRAKDPCGRPGGPPQCRDLEGQIFFDRTPLVERDPVTEEPVYRMENLTAEFPDITKELLEEKIAESQESQRQGEKRMRCQMAR